MTKRLCTLLCTYSKSVIFCYKLNWDGQGTYTWADGRIDNGIWKDGELVEPN